MRNFFEKCRKYGISLKPKKTLFGLEEGKIKGNIISKEGIRIDPNRVESIMKIDPPRNKKEVHSFIGRINFLKRFIPNMAKILRAITNMLKKDIKIKWNNEAYKSFSEVNLALTTDLVLISPIFIEDFMIFSFSYGHTIATVLLQKK